MDGKTTRALCCAITVIIIKYWWPRHDAWTHYVFVCTASDSIKPKLPPLHRPSSASMDFANARDGGVIRPLFVCPRLRFLLGTLDSACPPCIPWHFACAHVRLVHAVRVCLLFARSRAPKCTLLGLSRSHELERWFRVMLHTQHLPQSHSHSWIYKPRVSHTRHTFYMEYNNVLRFDCTAVLRLRSG